MRLRCIKSQGSEFKIVIIPVYDGPYMLLNRNLLYTAVTRAKNVAVLVGSENIIRKMIDNNKETRRYSGLCDFLARGDTKVDIGASDENFKDSKGSLS